MAAGGRRPADLLAFGAEHGWPVVLKAARGGYDGRGVWLVDDAGQAAELAATLLAGGTSLIVEERVALRRELAVQVARSPFGQVAAYPVVETVQRDGICVEVLAPAPGLPEELAVAAQQLAIDLATALGVVGLLAVELFETDAGLVVNELAMRPHNSGHWTIEGARTSQFEQHLRAVLDYPMGDTSLTAPVVVMANVLGGEPGGIVDRRAAAPPLRRRAGRQGPPVRQAGPTRPQDRARHGARGRPGRRTGAGRAGRPLAAGGDTA